MKAIRASIRKRGSAAKPICSDDGDVAFAHRAKGDCRLQGPADCAEPGACVAVCD